MIFLKGLVINLQFFTMIPIHREMPMDHLHLRAAVRTFPILGLLQGVLYAGLLYLLIEWTSFSPLASSFMLWLFMIVLTGAIHLDGWMDSSDAFFSYRDKEKRLEIMKDPRVGAFGVISIIILLSCRFLFIYEITVSITNLSYLLIGIIPLLSKGIMGAVLVTVKSAKDEGLALLFQKAADSNVLFIYPVYFLLILGLISLVSMEALILTLLLLVVSFACYFFSRRKSVKWFGGITGDVVGATVEGTELVLWMTVWLLHYFVMG
ncbi:adenosylcobinamide-GDP ribazoletransferase [Cytobacillus sp. FJAT-54145]|uniref:Adenosylcobinamide-GDP ribazoletransferase n=1 Tax=Cytobacillus spartinae TaxID=3299023 RepID=A0ABW6KFN7_9BACI